MRRLETVSGTDSGYIKETLRNHGSNHRNNSEKSIVMFLEAEI